MRSHEAQLDEERRCCHIWDAKRVIVSGAVYQQVTIVQTRRSLLYALTGPRRPSSL